MSKVKHSPKPIMNTPPTKIRPSPTESATLFPEGYIKVGNDKHEYVVVSYGNGSNKTKRWKKYSFNEIATIKDINIALKTLSAKHKKVFDIFDKLKIDTKKLGLKFILTGINFKRMGEGTDGETFDHIINSNLKYVLVIFNFIKDYNGNVSFIIGRGIEVRYSVIKVKDLIKKYFVNYNNFVADDNAKISFEKLS